MTMVQSTPAKKAEALVSALDEDIRHLEVALSRLDGLRGLLIKRDDEGLEALLATIAREAEAHAANERRRRTLGQDLARALGRSGGHVTLSELQDGLPDEWRAALAQRQTQLRTLVANLKRQYSLTAALLADCARFNRSLIRAFFGTNAQPGVTYRPDGAPQQHADGRFVSLQL
jgi:hypothetical protein